jgi:hypothetical protein
MKIEIRFEFESQAITPQVVREALSQDALLKAIAQTVDRVKRELEGVICPDHHQTPHLIISAAPSGDLHLDIVGCCEKLVEMANAQFQSLAQTAYFRPGMALLIQVEGADRPLAFDFQSIDMLIIGRSDPTIGEEPDIDLRDFGALEKGISRRHAAIFWQNGALNLTDEGSDNGTYLNGENLIAHRPYVLRNGDRITMGGLNLTLWLEYR